jgi:UDP-glucuronate 4-epimerase
MLLLTGAAGFIGSHTARRLVEAGHEVLGVDSVNSYYDPGLKRARLEALSRLPGFRFAEVDIADFEALKAATGGARLSHIVHLAAQAGVRYSLEAPFAYERANLAGHLSILELARGTEGLQHLVYASSSSVYGDRDAGPFRESDRTDSPASLYAATKKANELMSETYARLYGIPQTGLRFFTVYGPWGRPDMAYFFFTQRILAGETIRLFGDGKLARDFTYIDDVAPTVAKIAFHPPQGPVPHEIYNIGNSKPTTVLELVSAIEGALGKEAVKELAPPQLGDVTVTFADHSRAAERFGFAPVTTIKDGIPNFVAWYRDFYRV